MNEKTVRAVCPPFLHPIACMNDPSLLVPETELDRISPDNYKYEVNWGFIAVAAAATFNKEIRQFLKIGYEYAKPVAIEGYNIAKEKGQQAYKYLEKKYAPPPPPIWPSLSPARKFLIGQHIKENSSDPDVEWKVQDIAEKTLQRDPHAYDFLFNRRRNPRFSKKYAYRIQNKKGKGPYRSKDGGDIFGSHDFKVRFRRIPLRLPPADDTGFTKEERFVIEDKLGSKNFITGFSSIAQLRRWFNNNEELERMHKKGYAVYKIPVRSGFVSKRQVVFVPKGKGKKHSDLLRLMKGKKK